MSYSLVVSNITNTADSVVFYFTTSDDPSDPYAITAMYETPYTSGSQSIIDFGVFDTITSSEYIEVIFISGDLANAYNMSPNTIFKINGAASYGYTITADDIPQTGTVTIVTGSPPPPGAYILTVSNIPDATESVDFYFVMKNPINPFAITAMYETPYTAQSQNITVGGFFDNNINFKVIGVDFTSNELANAYGLSSTTIFNIEGTTLDGYTIKADDTPQTGTVTIDGPTSCFNEGTKILTLNKELVEEYVKIEELRKGDLVKCYKGGYRRIDMIGKWSMINNRDNWKSCMYKMSKTDENGLIEDLIVTGGHSMLVDELGECKEANEEAFGCKSAIMIEDKKLLLASVSKSFKKVEENGVYTYYHFVVENDGDDSVNYGVWANGVLMETMSKEYFKSHMI